jgi:hypothetical protein
MQRPAVQAPLSHPGMIAAGNLHRDPGEHRGGPGSPSVAYLDWEPGPQPSGPQIPVSYPGDQDRPAAQPARDGSIAWTLADDIPGPGPWTEVE